MAKTPNMRNRGLHDALRAFAVEAARLLRGDQDAGAEIEFDLDEGAGHRGPTLYHYRPLTGRFVAERWSRLRALDSCGPAADALGSGAAAYLRVNGLRGAEAEPALRAMLARLYDDVTDFSFPEERFERVYEEVERTLYERSQPATVLVPVHGLELQVERVELGDGLALARGDRTDAPDEAVWGDAVRASDEAAGSEPNVLLMLTRDVAPDDPLPAREARRRFRALLTGLRLFKPGGVALAGLAWRRSGDGRWQPFELEPTGSARGERWILVDGEDPELLEFLHALERSTPGGAVAWALSRFEMGCGRRFEAEALSDYLLGLRALLDAGPQDARSSLAASVAVLCAEEGERKRVQRRIELAQALERFVMGDGPNDEYLDAIGSDSPRTLVHETERHLRALLRDVMCGYLDSDLRRLADDLLFAPQERSGVVDDESGTFDPLHGAEPVAGREIHVERVSATEGAELEPSPDVEPAPPAGVIEAEPPLFDDDPASYSAPV